jgi:predicted house-cleaning noncanonical NTP pyrophosphatase (MazG superfamily)
MKEEKKKLEKQQAAKPVEKQQKMLVRDKVPGILSKGGAKPIIRVADDEEYVYALKHKILEEIIDIMEAVNAYIKHKKVSIKNAERMRKYKLRKRGGFDKRVILDGVE